MVMPVMAPVVMAPVVVVAMAPMTMAPVAVMMVVVPMAVRAVIVPVLDVLAHAAGDTIRALGGDRCGRSGRRETQPQRNREDGSTNRHVVFLPYISRPDRIVPIMPNLQSRKLNPA